MQYFGVVVLHSADSETGSPSRLPTPKFDTCYVIVDKSLDQSMLLFSLP